MRRRSGRAERAKKRNPTSDRSEDEDPFDPDVRADVEPPDREDERDGSEQDRRSASETPLQNDGSARDCRLAPVPPRGLDDAYSVATERGRQDLPGGVGDEVGAGEPGEALFDPLRAQEPAPARSQHRNRQNHDRGRGGEPRKVGLAEHVERRRKVDLPDEVADRKRGEHERAPDPYPATHSPSARPRTSRVSSSNAMFAAGWLGPSWGGLTSTTS